MRNHAAQLAIIKQLSRQELHSTAGNCQADDRQESCSSAGNLPVVRQVVDNDFEQLYYDQLAERQLFRYPPYYRLVYVYLKHRKEEVLTLAADMLANYLRTVMGDRILGPDKPPVARIQTLFIKKIVIKVEQSASMKKVRDYLLSVQRMLVEDERFRSLIVYYDVDPQ